MTRSPRAGFTILEVVTALVIISLVGISALTEVGHETRAASYATAVTRAASLAEERMIAANTLSATQLQALPDTMAAGRFPPPDEAYSWRMTSRPIVNEFNLNDVVIDVRWPNGTFTLRTRVYVRLESPQ